MSAVLMSLDLAAQFLEAIASAPAASSFLTPIVDEVLKAGAALIQRGDEGAVALQTLTQQIKNMVAAGRDPTDDEMAALKARSDAAHATIQSANLSGT